MAGSAISKRVLVPSVGAAPRPCETEGIVIIVVQPWNDFPGLVLVSDEQGSNAGASATNAMESLIGYVASDMLGQAGGAQFNWIEIDSEGMFDHVHPIWEAGVRPAVSQWAPVIWPGVPRRTEAAFRGLFGQQGAAALQALGEQRARARRA